MSVVDTVEILKGRPLSDDEYFKSALLGWCIELVSITSVVIFLLNEQADSAAPSVLLGI